MTSGMVNKEGNPPIMNEANNGVKNLKWTLSMARTNDPHSASSQFFINLVNNTSLDHTEETVQGWQDGIEGRIKGLQTGSYARILKMARKPSKQEFRQTVIVCGIGMLVLGLIGFVMLWGMDTLLPDFFRWLTN